MAWPNYLMPSTIVIVAWALAWPWLPRDREWVRWTLAGTTALIVLRYLAWRFPETVLPVDPWTVNGAWIWFLSLIELVLLLDVLRRIALLSRIRNRSREADAWEDAMNARPREGWPSVDVLLVTEHEPFKFLECSIVGSLGLDYPNFTLSVLDEGKRPWLRRYCEELGVVYVTDSEPCSSSAAIINLALTRSQADLVAVFDANFVPNRNFLQRTVGLFQDHSIGIVQTPQHLIDGSPRRCNLSLPDQGDDDQEGFHDPLAPALDAWGAMFCTGSGSVLRREALLAIDGVPTDSGALDVLATLQMTRRGFRTVYLNEALSMRIAPPGPEEAFEDWRRELQTQLRPLFLRNGFLGPGLTWAQRVGMFPLHWLTQVPARLLLILVPILYFALDLTPLAHARGADVLYWLFPVLFMVAATNLWYFGRYGAPIFNASAKVLAAARLLRTALSAGPRRLREPVMPESASIATSALSVSVHDLALVFALFAATVVTITHHGWTHDDMLGEPGIHQLIHLWGIINLSVLGAAMVACFDFRERRQQERFPVDLMATCQYGPVTTRCRLRDLSLSGARIEMGEGVTLGAWVTVSLPVVGELDARVIWTSHGMVGVSFGRLPGAVRNRLIRILYTSGLHYTPMPVSIVTLLRMLWREAFGKQRGMSAH